MGHIPQGGSENRLLESVQPAVQCVQGRSIYFGLGEDAVLLWKEGEEVDLPAATAAQEEMWAIAELPPQEVPQE